MLISFLFARKFHERAKIFMRTRCFFYNTRDNFASTIIVKLLKTCQELLMNKLRSTWCFVRERRKGICTTRRSTAKIKSDFTCSDQRTLCNMPPDRPDASAIETDMELNSTQDYKFGEAAYTMNDKEKENASVLADTKVSTKKCSQGEIPRCEKPIEKNNQSDDELTSLSWLHQQNLLKGLEISNPSKDMKRENRLNNNVCEDMADFSENTNSISSLDDSFCPGKIYCTHTPAIVIIIICELQIELIFLLGRE